MLSTDLARPSEPAAGRTVQGAIARLSQPFYEASLRWVAETDQATATAAARRFEHRYAIQPADAAEPSESGTARIVSFLLCALLAARLSRRASVSCSVAEAEQWLVGGAASDETVSTVSWPSAAVYHPLSSVPYDERLADAFPLVGEVFVTGPTGTSRSSSAAHRNNRRQKRRTGVFYTPSDVADFLARGAVARWKALAGGELAGRLPRCIDPACGTGILLRSVLDALASDRATRTAEERLAIASECLLGIDLNVVALDVCAFALLVWCQRSDGELKDRTPYEAWRAIRANLLHADARDVARAFGASGGDSDQETGDGQTVPTPPRQLTLSLSTSPDRLRYAARMMARGPFDLVIANPPFAQLSQRSGSTVRRNAYAPFVRMMWLLTKGSKSVAAIVVPLSIAYSSAPGIRQVRRAVAATGGTWEFAFFDRTPDSLFGDDVKTRAATAFLTRRGDTQPLIGTTSLLRWNSRERRRLFESIRFVWLPPHSGDSVLPKLGSDSERDVYYALRARKGEFGHAVATCISAKAGAGFARVDSARMLLIGATAYNYIPLLPLCTPRADPDCFGSTAWGVVFADDDHLWSALALLSSRLTYWLWRVDGDGFHVPQQFIMDLPLPVGELAPRLGPLGRKLWTRMRERPVKSVNKGRETTSYSPVAARDQLTEIDRVVLEHLGLPVEFAEYLKRYQREVILAGRDAHDRLQHHLVDDSLE